MWLDSAANNPEVKTNGNGLLSLAGAYLSFQASCPLTSKGPPDVISNCRLVPSYGSSLCVSHCRREQCHGQGRPSPSHVSDRQQVFCRRPARLPAKTWVLRQIRHSNCSGLTYHGRLQVGMGFGLTDSLKEHELAEDKFEVSVFLTLCRC